MFHDLSVWCSSSTECRLNGKLQFVLHQAFFHFQVKRLRLENVSYMYTIIDDYTDVNISCKFKMISL